MPTIIGTSGNDTLQGYYDYYYGTIDALTGGGGNDIFVYSWSGYNSSIIKDFGGVSKGTNPTAAVVAEVDTLRVYSGTVCTIICWVVINQQQFCGWLMGN